MSLGLCRLSLQFCMKTITGGAASGSAARAGHNKSKFNDDGRKPAFVAGLRQGDGYNADNRKGSKPQHDRPGRGNAESKQNMSSLSGLEVQKSQAA